MDHGAAGVDAIACHNQADNMATDRARQDARKEHHLGYANEYIGKADHPHAEILFIPTMGAVSMRRKLIRKISNDALKDVLIILRNTSANASGAEEQQIRGTPSATEFIRYQEYHHTASTERKSQRPRW
ncbi:hypothetical protein [Paenirhodobacter sp.]|uniref:hypothetical protein n=1 Tax=Paenirhodobacter sp. TaxID=1965326 RepID=UPI003B419248